MNVKALLILSATMAFMLGCAKKPAQELTPAAPVEEAKPASVDTMQKPPADDSLQKEALEEQRLENQRQALEDLMNRLMSEEIYFEFDKAVLTEKAKDLLAQAGDILAKEPRLWVEVEGHTDERGTEAYNMALGGKRAQSVVDYLINYGVSSDRLKSVSYGEERPKVEGASEEAYAQNRRARFNVKISK
ncbi:MAG TPA: OmpA family protein [Fibrobacteraceae bacterium]|nr:OmpA family protein [Fibrobacteraceae bacterium]